MINKHVTSLGHPNIARGVALLLVLAGIFHALPGPTLKLQAKEMGMPQWFIMCAGLLMLGSGTVYFFLPALGLYAVALCMGGAVATALKMPAVMHRPGGAVFSCLTLGAALWAAHAKAGSLSLTTYLICAVCYLAGILGRLFVPSSKQLAKLFAFLEGPPAKSSKKGNEGAAKAQPKNPKEPETVVDAAKADASKAGGARKRAASPGPREHKAETTS